MVTNKRITIDVDGDDKTYYFNKQGAAYCSTIISDYVYGVNGQLVTDAGEGNTYERVTLKKAGAAYNEETKEWELKNNKGEVVVSGTSKTEVLINEKGKIKKSGSVSKDMNEDKVEVKDYKVIKVESESDEK